MVTVVPADDLRRREDDLPCLAERLPVHRTAMYSTTGYPANPRLALLFRLELRRIVRRLLG
jgi:hypothetical protein